MVAAVSVRLHRRWPKCLAASAPWATSGCGMSRLAVCPRKSFWRRSIPLLQGRAREAGGQLPDLVGHRRPFREEWARRLGLKAGIPIPVGAFDAHWDAIGAGIREGDVVNVVGTSTCIMAIAREADLVPGVCGVVKGSIHPDHYGIEAGLSATGDIFEAIATRAGPPASPSCRKAWTRGAPVPPACCAPPGTTATAPCW